MLGFVNRVWWRLMPGTTFKVKWPVGAIIEEFEDQYKTNGSLFSSDPNEHYRPFLEKYVGRQGWDWDWAMIDTDITENLLTVKLRRGKEKYATLLAMRWS